MNGHIANRAAVVPKSPTSVLNEKAADLRRQGLEVLDLAQGEAGDIFTPEHVKQAAAEALRLNETKYTATGGTLALRESICQRFSVTDLYFGPGQVMASTGAKQCIFNFLMATLNPGDEVLVPSPYWVSYLNQVELAGGRPVVVPAEPPAFKLTGEAVRRHTGPKTRALILNNPCNPTGVVYSREELEGILEAALAGNLLVLADEVYDRLTYDGRSHVSIGALGPEAAANTVTVNAASKSYCMTGWRLGFAGGPKDVIGAMERIQSHSTSCPNALAQAAVRAALDGDQGPVARLRIELEARRQLAATALNALPGVSCPLPEGAFYLFPRVSRPLGASEGSAGTAFAEALLEATGVMLVPGAAFGADEHVRLCFAAARPVLEQAIARMQAWLAEPASPVGGTYV